MRGVAEDVTARVLAALGRAPVPCRMADTRVDEGDFLEATPDARVRQGVREEVAVARLAVAEMGWTDQRKDAEIDAVKLGMRTPRPIPEPVA